MLTLSAHFSDRPSMAIRKLWLLLSTQSLTTESSDITIGRVFRLWGATAVMANTGVPGTIMGPPLLSE